jgi:hypothetical protein
MSFVGSIAAGQQGGYRYSGQTRGRVQGSPATGVNYPSPFFDIAHTYLPVTVKQMLRWCRYYFLTNPVINAAVCKLSEYPVTDIIIEHPDSRVRSRWLEYFQDHLRFRSTQIESGLDYHCFGNAFQSLGFPFKKYLTCQKCGFKERADKIRQRWIFTSNAFRLTCPTCQTTGEAIAHDLYYKNADGINIIRWNCEHIEVNHNDATGDSTYFYNIPPTIRNDIVIGKKDIVETIPQVFIQAIRQQKGIVFSKDNFFHMKRPTLAQQDRGWGIPLILPVLKDTFYLQIMKKAQECVAPGTLLDTELGLRPACEVQVGDRVKTHLGGYQSVSQKVIRPMVEARGDYAVRLTSTGMRQLSSVVSDNHPMWILRRNDINRRKDSRETRRSSYVLRNPDLYAFDWVDAGQVSVGDYVGYPTARTREAQSVDLARYTQFVHTDGYVYSGVSLPTAVAFETLERGEHVVHDNAGRVAKRRLSIGSTPKRSSRYMDLDEDLAYIAGWYVGDGSIGARRVDFSMGPDDDGLELQEAIERVFGVGCSAYPCEDSRGWMLSACEVIFSEFMAGWIPGHAKTKRVPREILEAEDSVVLAFLRGYLEADGWQRSDDEKIAVCCSNGPLLYQLWSLLLSLGCISTLSERTSYDTIIRNSKGEEQELKGGRPTFHWSVSNRSARRLNQLMRGEEAEVVTSGKSGFFIHGYFAARIQKTEVVDCPEVVSFEIEGEHTFCLPGMATHNSILLEHIVPLRILFPQAGSGTSDPYTSVNLADWRDQVASEIARWRYDNNYIPILPLPLGSQTVGGDGRALLLTQEIQIWSEQIMVGMGVPKEFLLGGMSYAGTNVSMRMLENAFLSYIGRQKQYANWVMQQVAAYMGWPCARVKFKPFKMADDLQRKAYLFQLNGANKISDTTLLADSDLDQEDENEIMIRETDKRIEAMRTQQIAMATIQGEAQQIMMKFQAKAQQTQQQAMLAGAAPGEPGDAGGAPLLTPGAAGGGGATGVPQDAQSQLKASQDSAVNINDLAVMLARQYATLSPDMQQVALKNLEAQSPELAQLVLQEVSRLQAQGQTMGMGGALGASVSGVDTRALPDHSSASSHGSAGLMRG